MPRNTLHCSENPSCNCLEVLCCMNTPTNNSSQLPWILHPQLFECFTKVFEILFDLLKILSNLLLLKFLRACIMVKSHKLSNLIGILCHYHFELVDSICCRCSQSPVKTSIRPFDSDVTPDMSLFSANQTLIDCRDMFFCNLLIFWSEPLLLVPPDLVIIIPSYLSFEIIQMSL